MTRLSRRTGVFGDFEKALPREIVSVSRRVRSELIIPLTHVTKALDIARDHSIAVLGVESMRWPSTETYSGYEITFDGDWANFVSLNDRAASEFISKHEFGDGCGYLLTTASQNEFRSLEGRQVNGSIIGKYGDDDLTH